MGSIRSFSVAVGFSVCIGAGLPAPPAVAGDAPARPGDLPVVLTSPSTAKRVELSALADCLGRDAVASWKASRATVLIFVGTQCPLAGRYGPRLGEIAERFHGKPVSFFAVDSNQQDSMAAVSHFAQLAKIPFPVCKDACNKVADFLGATRTPECFVLDGTGVVRYSGLIDDQFGVGYAHDKAKRRYLEEALVDIVEGRAVRTVATRPVGCRIGRSNRRPPQGNVTYAGQISRILQAHCVECHRPGEAAPFALTTYAEAADWAETIREVIDEGRMPPWRANPAHGKFRNDARLSAADQQLVRDWIDNGVPQGNPRDLPPKPVFSEGWRIPKPDLVIKMPAPFTVPATGVVDYKYFMVDPGFTHDVWFRGAEARPGNRSVVHHMLLFYLPPEQAWARPEDPLFKVVAGFAPGLPPTIGAEGFAGRIPAGSRLVFQMHYTPNGTEQTDQSEVGLILTDAKTVRRQVSVGGIFNWQFLIPPGDSNYHVQAQEVLDEDRIVYDLVPHMHLRGKAFRFTAYYPDRHKEILLDVPRYDFNWQDIYRLAEPKLLPAGTRLECTALFDNSESNLLNPDPTSSVHWGDQTWDEMMVGSYDYSPAGQDFSLGPPRVTPAADGRYDVAFRYVPSTRAHAVYLAGTFNGWKPTGQRLAGPDKSGAFTVSLRLSIGRYEYKYVIDGKTWKNDPGNMAQVGEYLNNVLVVGPLEPPRVVRHSDGAYAATFRYRPPAPIKNVSVVGTFNHWKAAGQMQGPDRDGWYAATVAIPEGRQEYKFLVDGKNQVPDPGNPVSWGKKGNSVVWARP